MRAINTEDECNDTYGRIRMYQALLLKKPEGPVSYTHLGKFASVSFFPLVVYIYRYPYFAVFHYNSRYIRFGKQGYIGSSDVYKRQPSAIPTCFIIASAATSENNIK